MIEGRGGRGRAVSNEYETKKESGKASEGKIERTHPKPLILVGRADSPQYSPGGREEMKRKKVSVSDARRGTGSNEKRERDNVQKATRVRESLPLV